MIKLEDYKEGIDFVAKQWGEDFVELVLNTKTTKMTMKEFLKHCYCCGGNWGGMLLTGIKELYPKVWEAIPDDMGIYAFTTICNALMLLGIDTSSSE